MGQSDENAFSRHWKLWLFVLWILSATLSIYSRWNAIHWFSLGDTDDNMRMMQVRALLHGQDWFDLRQYRLNPPFGADIHWSRFVDLPIAGIILATKPFFGGAIAEKIAVAVAPIIPLGVAFMGLGLTVRRLVAPSAFIAAAGIMLASGIIMLMFAPLRIDHHGWQLALLTINVAGLADPKSARGGITTGIASALSLVIGLEMVPWLAISGAAVALRWIFAGEETMRLRGYGVALAGGTAAGYLAFASYANRVARCDALTPVWLSVMILAGALLFAISFARADHWRMRLMLAAIAGTIVVAFFVIAWPDCLGRPEQVSPELDRLWLSNIREARPLYTQNGSTIIYASALLPGLFGNLWAMWRERGTARGAAWAAIALLCVGSALTLVWQTRVAGAASLFAIPGATALGWALIPTLRTSKNILVRTFGVVAAVLVISGLWAALVADRLPILTAPDPDLKLVNKANASCPTAPSLAPIARLPRATIFTFVDISPRLITMTHHDAIAGPYHRNGNAILDVQHAFRGSADQARAIIKRHKATMLLICPNESESTIYAVQNPKGFYVQLVSGKVPEWLEPVPLPPNSPFKLWRVR